ncbi:CYTH domain-containing protein [Wandonia haliotis]|uniref:CYTH domain-containing protein n=1 Tax=Wandonia haliotis TaxID=574963 RepID=A0ABN1MP34_9FLAO
MGIEIERKFLVDKNKLSEEIQKNNFDKVFSIAQGYLKNEKEQTIRVRIKGEKGFLTIKGEQQGAIRAEYEYEIPVEDAEHLLYTCKEGRIIKKRYLIPYKGKLWEVDFFEEENEGLVVAEIELSEEREEFAKPKWLGDEITSDFRYTNAVLVKRPFKTW